MRKPEHQFTTRRLRARREPDHPGGAWDDDRRAEAFVLEDDQGRRGRAVLGLHRQVVSRELAGDPDLIHAVRCWLAARGRRRTQLFDDGGWLLDRAEFTMADLGDDVVATAGPLVTLAPSNAEIVEALGCFDRVVACEDSSDFPPHVEAVERLGPDLGPDLDRVAALSPALVLTSLSVPGMERVVTGLRARRVPQIVLAPTSIADVLAEIDRVAAALGVQEQGRAVVAGLQRERAALESSRVEPPLRVYLEWWPKPMFTPGRDCYSNELIALAGGVNVFGDREGASVRIEPHELVAARPDLCFVSWCGVAQDKLDPDNLIGRPGLEGLDAARRGAVFVLDEAFSGRPGPRMLEASRRMAAAIAKVRR